MTTHKINDREYLFLEVPKDACHFKDTKMGYLSFDVPNYKNWANNDILEDYSKLVAFVEKWDSSKDWNKGGVKVDGNYTILGLASDLTEEQAKEMVDYQELGGVGKYYFDYEIKLYQYTYSFTATESLHSLITSLGLNPERTLIIERKK